MDVERSSQNDQALFYHLSHFIRSNKRMLAWAGDKKIWRILKNPVDSEEIKSTQYASCALLVAEVYASNAIEISGIVRLHAKTMALEARAVAHQTTEGTKTIVSPIDIPRMLGMHEILAKKDNFISVLSYDAYQFVQTLRSMRTDIEEHGLTPKIPGYDLLLNNFEMGVISKIPLFIRRLDITLGRVTEFEKASVLTSFSALANKFRYSDAIFTHLDRFFLELMLINPCNVIRKPGDFLFNSAACNRVNAPIMFFDKSFYCLHDKSLKEVEFYKCSLNVAASKGLDALQKSDLLSCFFNLSYSLVEKERDDLAPLHEARKRRKL